MPAGLSRLNEAQDDTAAYPYATICAQRGNLAKAPERLDKAMRIRYPSIEKLKVDPVLDPLRKEPSFQAIEQELKFPNREFG